MASTFHRTHFQTIKISNPSFKFPNNGAFRIVFSEKSPISVHCSLSSPPSSREEAILQAKTSLWTTLGKPLNSPKLAGKMKRLKQPRFQVEIPVVDDSPDSLARLAFDVFGEIPIKRKGSTVKISIVWPSSALAETARKAFGSRSPTPIEHVDASSFVDGDTRSLNSSDTVVFFAPATTQLAVLETVTQNLYPKPVVLFNPKWVFEEESGFDSTSGFPGTFEVVYSFAGMEVRGILSNRKGAIYRCVRDGVLSGERWSVLVEEEEGGDLKVVSQFKARPSIAEVENVLYNFMAINSPVTKSVKFLKEMVAKVTGKNGRR